MFKREKTLSGWYNTAHQRGGGRRCGEEAHTRCEGACTPERATDAGPAEGLGRRSAGPGGRRAACGVRRRRRRRAGVGRARTWLKHARDNQPTHPTPKPALNNPDQPNRSPPAQVGTNSNQLKHLDSNQHHFTLPLPPIHLLPPSIGQPRALTAPPSRPISAQAPPRSRPTQSDPARSNDECGRTSRCGPHARPRRAPGTGTLSSACGCAAGPGQSRRAGGGGLVDWAPRREADRAFGVAVVVMLGWLVVV